MKRKWVLKRGSRGWWIAFVVAVVSWATVGVVVYHTFSSRSPLSPARNLTGTWKTSFPTKYYCATNEDTGTFVDFGSEDRQVTWVITEGAYSNTVDIEQYFTESNRQKWDPKVVDLSPTEYTGIISSSSLTVETYYPSEHVVGSFSFTTDIITGTWSDTILSFNHNVHTATNGLTLTRQ